METSSSSASFSSICTFLNFGGSIWTWSIFRVKASGKAFSSSETFDGWVAIARTYFPSSKSWRRYGDPFSNTRYSFASQIRSQSFLKMLNSKFEWLTWYNLPVYLEWCLIMNFGSRILHSRKMRPIHKPSFFSPLQTNLGPISSRPRFRAKLIINLTVYNLRWYLLLLDKLPLIANIDRDST